MKFFTFKIKSKPLLFVFLILLVLLCLLIEFSSSKVIEAPVNDNASRVSYIKNLGIEIEEELIEEKSFVIPEKFTNVFLKYNDLQLRAGFDLIKYSGKTATIFKYKAKNFNNSMVYVNLIVLNGRVIGGDISSVELDGFMLPLKELKN